MYREADARSKTPPTRIEYKASRLRFQGVLFALVTLLFAAALVSVAHASRLSCTRHDGMCTITRHSVFVPYDRARVPIADVEKAEYETRTSNKGSYAEVRLRTRAGGVVPLGTGFLGSRFDVADAKAGVSELSSFLADPNVSSFEAVFWSSHFASILSFLLGLVVARVAYSVVREQVVQYFPIRVTVDHERKLLLLPGRINVRFDDVDEIILHHGRALFWASGKNEHIPGFRIIVRTKNGVVIPLTQDHRVGPESLHEKARRNILTALGKTA